MTNNDTYVILLPLDHSQTVELFTVFSGEGQGVFEGACGEFDCTLVEIFYWQ